LFCGIGGCAAALPSGTEVAAAIDINRGALAVYASNFSHPAEVRAIESLAAADLRGYKADVWWMSPPCQPFTRRGRYRDDRDPRTRAVLNLLEPLAQIKPPYVLLENVPGFVGSRTHALLREALDKNGYTVEEHMLNPVDLGIPNQRERLFLVAGRDKLEPPRIPRKRSKPLASYLDSEFSEDLLVDPDEAEKYQNAIDVVDPADEGAIAACFTSAYGRSMVRSGSYIQLAGNRLRRFSPAEILRLLHFPKSYEIPAGLPLGSAWRLVGNSLSIPCVSIALSQVPGLR
jgi:site-specific DNA-cytosine methylase